MSQRTFSALSAYISAESIYGEELGLVHFAIIDDPFRFSKHSCLFSVFSPIILLFFFFLFSFFYLFPLCLSAFEFFCLTRFTFFSSSFFFFLYSFVCISSFIHVTLLSPLLFFFSFFLSLLFLFSIFLVSVLIACLRMSYSIEHGVEHHKGLQRMSKRFESTCVEGGRNGRA